jgi:hypothetical protein
VRNQVIGKFKRNVAPINDCEHAPTQPIELIGVTLDGSCFATCSLNAKLDFEKFSKT